MAKLIEITGKALSGEWGTDDAVGNGIPVLRTTNFTNEGVVNYDNVVTRTIAKKNIAEKFLQVGDIIIEKSGGSDKQPVGRVIYFDGPENTYLFNNFTGLLRVKDCNTWFPKYVFYSLFANYRKGGTRQFENRTTGLHNLKTDDYVSRYVVKDVAYNEQICICSNLDRIWNIIQLRRAELEKLDELVKARFVEMFGDSEMNPRGWEMVPIGVLVSTIESGWSGKGTQRKRKTGEIAVLKVSAVTSGVFLPDECKVLDDQENIKKSVHPEKGDLIFSRANTREMVGATAIVHDDYRELILPDKLWKIRFSEKVDIYYMKYILSSKSVREKFSAVSTGTSGSMYNVSMDKFKNIAVPLPPKLLQEKFADFVTQIDKSKVAVQKSLDEAQLLFDSLMQKYFG